MTTTKNTSKLIIEIIITLIVAFLISAILALLLSIMLGNSVEGMTYVNSISSAAFGLIVGYKLNSLIRSHG